MTRRKPPTCRKSLTNIITWCCTLRSDCLGQYSLIIDNIRAITLYFMTLLKTNEIAIFILPFLFNDVMIWRDIFHQCKYHGISYASICLHSTWSFYYYTVRSVMIILLLSSDYPFVIFWLPFCDLLITLLWSSDYPFVIFWLPFCYLLIILLLSSDYPFAIFWLPFCYLLIILLLSSDYPFVIFWLPFCYLLIILLLSSDYPFAMWYVFYFYNVSA
jgi:hypothetical protein